MANMCAGFICAGFIVSLHQWRPPSFRTHDILHVGHCTLNHSKVITGTLIFAKSPVVDPVAGWGGKKHEIYVAAFGSHLFYDLFSQGQGGMAPLPPWICYWSPQHHCRKSTNVSLAVTFKTLPPHGWLSMHG